MTALHGVVVAGLGQGASFMGLPWVREAIRRAIGFEPYPGTLNVRLVDPIMVVAWRGIREGPALRLAPPSPDGCGAQLFPAVLAPDVAAAVIVPDVTRHADDVLELVTAVHARTRLGLRDDDPVTLRMPAPPGKAPIQAG